MKTTIKDFAERVKTLSNKKGKVKLEELKEALEVKKGEIITK